MGLFPTPKGSLRPNGPPSLKVSVVFSFTALLPGPCAISGLFSSPIKSAAGSLVKNGIAS